MAGKGSEKTQFKPGESGNPSGRPKLPEDVVKAKSFNRVEAERVLNKLIKMTDSEFIEFSHRPDVTQFERLIASLIMKGIKEGDTMRINFLLDRLIGKVKDNVEVSVLRRTVKKLDGTIVEYSNQPLEEE